MKTRRGNPLSPSNQTDTTAANTATVPWGEENSMYNLQSDHFDLDYLFLYAAFGSHPSNFQLHKESSYTGNILDYMSDGILTNEEALALTTENHSDYRISINDTISINTSQISDEDSTIAWRAVETFALLTGHNIVETDHTATEHNDFNNGEFATITFGELEEGLKRSELPGYDPDGPESTYNDGIAGLAWSGVTRALPGEPNYFNGTVDVLPSLDTRFKQHVYIHEIAHIFDVIGSENSGLDTAIDNTRFLSTSYNSPGQHQSDLYFTPVTPMIVDILVIKQFGWLAEDILPDDTTFGLNANTGMSYDYFFKEMAKTENNFAMTIMDTGGYDTLDFSDHNTRVHGQTLRINMNPYWTSDVYNTPGNFIIGPDTWIEAAIGGVSDDHITGNIIDNHLSGNAGDDTLLGGPGDDVLQGGPGNDLLDGHTGNDTASYRHSPAAVTIRLEGYLVSGGNATGDTLISIESLIGSAYNDTLIGDSQNNVLEGGPGADRLDGRTGNDTASYRHSPAAVTIRLEGYLVSGGDAAGDTLISIESLIGSTYNDTLIGDSQNNILEGGDGRDTLIGNAGNDTAAWRESDTGINVRLHAHSATGGHAQGDSFAQSVTVQYTDANGLAHTDLLPDIENLIGSAHNDVLAGDRRDNVLDGQAGDDTLYGGPGGGDDIMHGGPGNDKLYGGRGADTLNGGAGNDVLAGGFDADALSGGPGLDTAVYKGSDTGVNVRLHAHSATGGHAQGDSFAQSVTVQYTDANGLAHTDLLPDIENLIGSAHNDVLAGDRRDNVLDGQAGDDTLYGGPGGGDDIMHGGPGNDKLYGGAGNDTLYGNDHNDELRGGSGNDKLYGGAGNDTLYGNDHNDELRGGDGNDKIYGNAGNDILHGGAGQDTLHGGPGMDTAVYTDSPAGITVNLLSNQASGGDATGDTFIAIENLMGSAFDDVLIGNGDDNIFYYSGGNDSINGGAGNDTVSYEHLSRADKEKGQHHGISLSDHTSIENLTGSAFWEYIYGNDQNNILTGLGGNGHLYGRGGNDTLIGGPDADWLYGGPGNDTLIPKGGRDTLIFEPGDGNDRILGFHQLDKIDLTAFDLPDTWEPFLRQDGNNTVLDLTRFDGGEIVFENVSLNENMDVFIV